VVALGDGYVSSHNALTPELLMESGVGTGVNVGAKVGSGLGFGGLVSFGLIVG
jgi:hypothetical protein